jgi:protein-S-isoprenylcysteine O-methyltransferase Ste14
LLWLEHLRSSFVRRKIMFVFFRAITYATLFIAFFLIYIPGNLLSGAGIVRPAALGWEQVAGFVVATVGALIAIWCVLTFIWVGKGTPAPFDPPLKLVIRGPYRFVRNPMYIGAATALAGASIYYHSWSLLAYAGAFVLLCHLFVVLYEEPTLRRTFEPEYGEYCRRIRRWWPTI